MDIASLLAGAGLFAAGFGTGLALGLPIRTAKGAKPIMCDCGHTLAAHDQKTTECTAAFEVSRYDSVGRWTGKEWKNCACKRYVGPLPPSDYYMPEPHPEENQ